MARRRVRRASRRAHWHNRRDDCAQREEARERVRDRRVRAFAVRDSPVVGAGLGGSSLRDARRDFLGVRSAAWEEVSVARMARASPLSQVRRTVLRRRLRACADVHGGLRRRGGPAPTGDRGGVLEPDGAHADDAWSHRRQRGYVFRLPARGRPRCGRGIRVSPPPRLASCLRRVSLA